MINPWEEISLTDYENHMKLDSVMQLQAMNEMMKGQFDAYPVSSVVILGIAGGNGLEHIRKEKIEKVYGVDINSSYLDKVIIRYPYLDGILECVCINLINYQIQQQALEKAMLEIDYHIISTLEYMLPNSKKLVQLDFGR